MDKSKLCKNIKTSAKIILFFILIYIYILAEIAILFSTVLIYEPIQSVAEIDWFNLSKALDSFLLALIFNSIPLIISILIRFWAKNVYKIIVLLSALIMLIQFFVIYVALMQGT